MKQPVLTQNKSFKLNKTPQKNAQKFVDQPMVPKTPLLGPSRKFGHSPAASPIPSPSKVDSVKNTFGMRKLNRPPLTKQPSRDNSYNTPTPKKPQRTPSNMNNTTSGLNPTTSNSSKKPTKNDSTQNIRIAR